MDWAKPKTSPRMWDFFLASWWGFSSSWIYRRTKVFSRPRPATVRIFVMASIANWKKNPENVENKEKEKQPQCLKITLKISWLKIHVNFLNNVNFAKWISWEMWISAPKIKNQIRICKISDIIFEVKNETFLRDLQTLWQSWTNLCRPS